MRLMQNLPLNIRAKVAVILFVSVQQDATVTLLDLEHAFSIPHSWLRTLTLTLLVHTLSTMLHVAAADWLDTIMGSPMRLMLNLPLNIRAKVDAVLSVSAQ
jgi:hypothetical protein